MMGTFLYNLKFLIKWAWLSLEDTTCLQSLQWNASFLLTLWPPEGNRLSEDNDNSWKASGLVSSVLGWDSNPVIATNYLVKLLFLTFLSNLLK
jgi:hypothetical protein